MRHYTSVNNRKKHQLSECTYLKGLHKFYKCVYASKEKMVRAFHDVVLPKKTCVCKIKTDPTWARRQRVALLNNALFIPFLKGPRKLEISVSESSLIEEKEEVVANKKRKGIAAKRAKKAQTKIVIKKPRKLIKTKNKYKQAQ